MSKSVTPAPDPNKDKEKGIARERAAAQHMVQDWQRLDMDSSDDSGTDSEDALPGNGTAVCTETDDGIEVYECVACDKTFLSEASWDNHERSKKHKQAVFRLKKEMKLESEMFSEDEENAFAEGPLIGSGDLPEDLTEAMEDEMQGLTLANASNTVK